MTPTTCDSEAVIIWTLYTRSWTSLGAQDEGSVWGEEDGPSCWPDRARSRSQERGREGGFLEDGGVGPRVEGDGGYCGGDERAGEESLRQGLQKVLLECQFSLRGREQLHETQQFTWG